MKLKQYSLVGISTNLIVAMTAQVGLAFSFTLPSRTPLPCDPFISSNCNKHSLTLPGADSGTVTTILTGVSSVPLGGTTSMFNLLTNSVWAKNGWQFQRATTDLSGSFNIAFYNAYAELVSVGANIQLLYNPTGQDPTGSNVHWIQRVRTNHGYIITRSGITKLEHGIVDDKIDVFQEQTQLNYKDPQNPQKPTFNPLYDTYSDLANQISFEDILGRDDIYQSHDWYADLYLVQETAPKQVTIYNGIRWGWKNTFTPPPPPPPPCNGGSGGGGCRTALVSNFTDTPVKVPEPIPALGLLALGVWGTFQGLKIMKDKK